jgi:hypothetical protein
VRRLPFTTPAALLTREAWPAGFTSPTLGRDGDAGRKRGDLVNHTRRNAAIALEVLIVGGVLVKRWPAIGAALVVFGLIITYFAIAGRDGPS